MPHRAVLMWLGLTVVVSAAVAGAWPAVGVTLALGALLVLTFLLRPMLGIGLLLVWLVLQGWVVSWLDMHGLARLAMWLRRSDDVAIVVLGCVVFVGELVRWGRVRLNGAGLPVACLLGAAGLSAWFVGHAPPFVAALDLVLLLKGVVIYGIVTYAVREERNPQVLRALWWILAVGGGAVVVASVEVVDPIGFRTLVGLPATEYLRAGWNSLQGPFVHPGVFGWVMGVCALVCIGLGLDKRRWAWWCLPVFVLGILASGRRKPIVGVLFGAMTLVWLSAPARRIGWQRVLKVVGVAAALALVFWPFVVDLVRSTVEAYLLPRDVVAQARDVMYITSAGFAIRHFPLGVGPGLFGGYAARLYYSPLYRSLGFEHIWGLSSSNPTFLNDAFWPHVLGEFGIAGLAAFLWLLVRLARPALARARGLPGQQRLVACIALAILTQALVESLASATFEVSLSAFVEFGLLALAAATPGGAWEPELASPGPVEMSTERPGA